MHGKGTYHTPTNKYIFGSLGDSAHDRWGRVLMRHAERQRAMSANESPRTMMGLDYLLRANDNEPASYIWKLRMQSVNMAQIPKQIFNNYGGAFFSM